MDLRPVKPSRFQGQHWYFDHGVWFTCDKFIDDDSKSLKCSQRHLSL